MCKLVKQFQCITLAEGGFTVHGKFMINSSVMFMNTVHEQLKNIVTNLEKFFWWSSKVMPKIWHTNKVHWEVLEILNKGKGFWFFVQGHI